MIVLVERDRQSRVLACDLKTGVDYTSCRSAVGIASYDLHPVGNIIESIVVHKCHLKISFMIMEQQYIAKSSRQQHWERDGKTIILRPFCQKPGYVGWVTGV